MDFSKEIRAYVDDKPVASDIYNKQKLLSLLTKDAQILSSWLKAQGERPMSIVELCKCGPISLRRVDKVRALLAEFKRLGLAQQGTGTIVYSAASRRDYWEFCNLP